MATAGLTPEQMNLLSSMLDQEGITGQLSVTRPRPGDQASAPLSFEQERLYVLHNLEPGSTRYVIGAAVTFHGGADIPALQAAVRAVFERHEALRTSIVAGIDGLPRQHVAAPEQARPATPVLEVAENEAEDATARLVLEPFDLTTAPLARLAIVRVRGRAEVTLAVAVHHIIADAWSLGILLNDMLASYRGQALPPPGARLADIAYWEHARADDDSMPGRLRYWSETLGGAPGAQLVADMCGTDTSVSAGDVVPFRLSEPVTRALREIATGEQATLFMTLLAGLACVLSRWTGHDDVTIAAPTSQRQRGNLDDVVGFFVGTLPLRVRIPPCSTFTDVVRACRQAVLDAWANEVPLQRLVRHLGRSGQVAGAGPLLRYALTYTDAPGPDLGPDVAIRPLHTGTAKFDLELQLAPGADGAITGWAEYATALYRRESVENLLTGLADILGEAAAEPGRPVRTLAAAGLGSLRLAAGRSGAEQAGRRISPAIPDLLRLASQRFPEATAVVVDGVRPACGYRQLSRRAEAVARGLALRGIGREDRVAICLDRGQHLITAILGVLAAGAAFVPIDPSLPASRQEQLIADSAPRLVIGSPGDVAALLRAGMRNPGIPLPAIDPRSAAYLLFTSGSTGRPKAAIITHAGIANRIQWMQDAYPIGPGDRVLQKTSVGFDVSVWELLWPVVTGAVLVFAAPGGHRDPRYLHEVMDRQQITVCHFVPSMARAFLQLPTAGLSTCRHVFCSGEELDPPLALRLRAALPGCRVHNLYGPTEAAIDVTAFEVTGIPAGRVPIGEPTPGNLAYVLDANMTPVPVGAPGQLYLGGVQLARGYHGRPGLTAARFVPSPSGAGERLYATGDRARWTPAGQLEFLERLDFQVKIRGNRVEPGEIAAVLRQHPEVDDAVVLAAPGPLGETQLAAYLLARAGADQVPLAAGACGLVRARLPDYMVPARILVMDQWPLTASGKLDRRALPAIAGPQDSGADPGRPFTPTEAALVGIWCEVLEIGHVAAGDSFFDVGGDSLLATYVVHRVELKMAVQLSLRQFFDHPQLAELAALIDAMPRTAQASAPIRAVDRAQYRLDEAGRQHESRSP